MMLSFLVVVVVVSSVNSQQNEHFGNPYDYHGHVQRPKVYARSQLKSVESQKSWNDRLGPQDSRLPSKNQRDNEHWEPVQPSDAEDKQQRLMNTVETAVNGAYGHRWIQQQVRAPSTLVGRDENNSANDGNRSDKLPSKNKYNANTDIPSEYDHSYGDRKSALSLQHRDLEIMDHNIVKRPQDDRNGNRPPPENVNFVGQFDNVEKSQSSYFNRKTNDNRKNIINQPFNGYANNEHKPRDEFEQEDQRKINAHRVNKNELNDEHKFMLNPREDEEGSIKNVDKNYSSAIVDEVQTKYVERLSESQPLSSKSPSTQNGQTDRTRLDEFENDDSSSRDVEKAIAPNTKDVFVNEDESDGSYWVVSPPPVTVKRTTGPLINEEHPREAWKSYSFDYAVRDDYSGADFGQWERRDQNGDGIVTGQYRVQLPDGRTQTVTYTAGPVTGYRASVTYKGVQHHPPPIPYPLSVPTASRTSKLSLSQNFTS